MKKVFSLIFLFLCVFFGHEKLTADATIEGVVTDAITGLPIQGALVDAVRGDQVRYSDTTAIDGSYSLTGINPSNYTLVVSASGYQTKSVGVKPANNQTTIVNVQLIPNGGLIEGVVSDSTTTLPISGATIAIFQDRILILTTTTNGSGFYSAPNLAPGNYVVLATDSMYQTQLKGGIVQVGAVTLVNFALELNPGAISGTVIDFITMQGIEGAVVEVFEDSILIGFADTDINGNYTIPNLPPGSYTITVTAIGYQSKTNGALVVSGMTTIENFALIQPPGAISGTVTNAGNGNPIPGASVNVFKGLTLIASVLTDSNGNYTIDTLSPGNYLVSAGAQQFSTSVVGAIVTAGNTTIVNFSLTANPGTISGTVIDSVTQTPISGSIVQVHNSVELVATAVTDNNGNYNIPNLDPDNYTITSTANNYQRSTKFASVNSNQITIVNFSLIPIPGIVAGNVTDSLTTNPIPNTTIAVFQGNTFITFALTDSNGNYEILNMAPGNYTVLAIAENYQSAFLTITVNSGAITNANFALELIPGTISGIVTDRCTGDFVPGALILVTDGSSVIGFGVTNNAGIYVIDTLPPGNYSVTAAKKNFFTNSVQATVLANQTTTVDFVLSNTVLPPTGIFGSTLKNKFLTQTDIIHVISWTASPSECVIGYQIFRNGKFISFVSSTSKLEYSDHNRRKKTDIYSVRAVNAFGVVSAPINIAINSHSK